MNTQKTEDNSTGSIVHSVFVIDDSFLMRNILKNILEKDNSFVVIGEAPNGQIALEMLDKDDFEPDIILLDIEMPIMDGIEFLKKSKVKIYSKIIIVSSLVELESPKAKEVLALGANDIIAKPSGVLSVDLEEKRSVEILSSIHRCMDLQV